MEGEEVDIILHGLVPKTEYDILSEQLFQLQSKLMSTDYKVLKWQEGWISNEEYEPIRQEREAMRQQIRDIEDRRAIALEELKNQS